MTDDVTPFRTAPSQLVRPALRIVATAAFLTVLYSLLPLRDGRWWLTSLIGIGAIGAIAPLTIRRVRAVRTAQWPTLTAVEALTQLFAMLVFGFGALYLAIDRDGTQFSGMETRVDAAYFTITTLSTVGFGDINATGQAARLAVSIQILIDFTVLAVAVRLLVNAARQRVMPGQPLSLIHI